MYFVIFPIVPVNPPTVFEVRELTPIIIPFPPSKGPLTIPLAGFWITSVTPVPIPFKN